MNIIEALQAQAVLMLNVIPSLIKGLIILIVGILLAKLVRRLTLRFLKTIGVDRLASKAMDIEMFKNSNINIVPSRTVAGFMYYMVIIVFSVAAVEAMGLTVISELLRDLIEYIPSGVTALIILIVGIFLADTVKKIITSACRTLSIPSGNLIANVVFYFILLNIVLIALRQARLRTEFMEDNIAIILAGMAGAFAIGYGLASRHIMSSILASFYNRDKFHIGDEITIDGMRGEVVTINNNTVILRSLNENSEYVIPYSKVSVHGVQIHTRRDKGPALPPHEG